MAKQNALFMVLVVLVGIGLYKEIVAMPSQQVQVQEQGVVAVTGEPCNKDGSEYKMALEESQGFFYDVPESDWETQRRITKMRVNNKHAANPLSNANNSPACSGLVAWVMWRQVDVRPASPSRGGQNTQG
eukprot:scaffold12929_cov50-Attheya_sp.AAC.4